MFRGIPDNSFEHDIAFKHLDNSPYYHKQKYNLPKKRRQSSVLLATESLILLGKFIYTRRNTQRWQKNGYGKNHKTRNVAPYWEHNRYNFVISLDCVVVLELCLFHMFT